MAGRNVLAHDLSPYAALLTSAKLNPYKSISAALDDTATVHSQVKSFGQRIDLRVIPKFVRSFFHPETLREILIWKSILQQTNRHFMLACLLGILHHQRPGFLSYPSSHTVPYLRTNRFPREFYPELYDFRDVRSRLDKKIIRAFKRHADLDFAMKRICAIQDASAFRTKRKFDAIITSPPYMRQLDYGRDNRLRLWFLNCPEWKLLDAAVSPTESQFLVLMRSCLKQWRTIITKGGRCVLILGDTKSRIYDMNLPDAVALMATKEIGGYTLRHWRRDEIPTSRRVRRNYRGNESETILILENRG